MREEVDTVHVIVTRVKYDCERKIMGLLSLVNVFLVLCSMMCESGRGVG